MEIDYDLPADEPNLEADLAKDPEFLRRIQDEDFVVAVSFVFTGRDFFKGDDPRPFGLADRHAAMLIADLRDPDPSLDQRLSSRAEPYVKYFWYGHDHVERSGWPEDRAADIANILEEIDKYLRDSGAGARALELSSDDSRLVRLEKAVAALAASKGARVASPDRAEIDESQDLEQRAQLLLQDLRQPGFADLHACLTRLGWRTATYEDSERSYDYYCALYERVDAELFDLYETAQSRKTAEPEELTAAPIPKGGWGRISKAVSDLIASGDPPAPPVEPVPPEDARGLLDQLAADGDVTDEEYAEFYERIRAATYPGFYRF